jgi:hypothetical protein
MASGQLTQEKRMPERVQLIRTKGWQIPPNTVKVDRTTKWGNPFIVGQENPFIPGRIVEDRRHAWSLYLGFAPQNEKLIAAPQDRRDSVSQERHGDRRARKRPHRRSQGGRACEHRRDPRVR